MFNKKLKLKLLTLMLLFIAITTTGLRCKLSDPKIEELEQITLNVWGVWESAKDMSKIFQDFKARHPDISINYRQFRYSEYEKQILSAMADRQEPDIIFIHNTWLGDYLDKLEPMPASVESTTVSWEGTIKKEQIISTEKRPTPSLKKIKDTYLSVVYDDVLREDKDKKNRIYSLPLYTDTLVLFYNKDILDNAGILGPPTTWDEFQQDVRLITRQDENGILIQSGAALGASDNVERYFDILSLLMMQLGSPMVEGRSIVFHTAQQGVSSAGADALRFYTDFASPNTDVYTWNKSMGNSIDEFALGRVAFIFGYSYHIDRIRAKNSKLNFDIAKVPQARDDREINYASYWTPVVLKTTENKDAAWNFITYASSPQVVDSFLEASGRPPAIKEYLKKYEEDFDLAPFVGQLLTAKSWYKGRKASEAEIAFGKMINKVFTAEDLEKTEVVINEAVQAAASEAGKEY